MQNEEGKAKVQGYWQLPDRKVWIIRLSQELHPGTGLEAITQAGSRKIPNGKRFLQTLEQALERAGTSRPGDFQHLVGLDPEQPD